MLFKSRQLWILGLLTLPLAAIGQKENLINFINPSFEDLPKCCEAPTGWYNCGKADETAPDIQPGSFQVTKPPSNGETYLGLVVRDNDTWEGVSQRLSIPLDVNQCYEFSLDLCRAELYLSLSRTTREEVNYATPAKVRVWGGMGYCDKREMLYETPLITTTRWLTYNFRLSPKKGTYSFLYIEAYFKTPTLFPYNGNILIDNASPIKQINCNMPPMEPGTPPVVVATPPKPTPSHNTGTGTKTPPVGIDTQRVTETNKPPTKITRTGLKKGDVIRLDKVYFDADKYIIKTESVPSLTEVFNFLRGNPDVAVEIGGHTNNRPTDEFALTLSTNRAKSVAEWLIDKGIPSQRVQYKGYGKSYPIENNVTPEGRMKNQRVEIKILNING